MSSFIEVAIYQVKPTKVEAFENILEKVVALQKIQEGCIDVRYLKRGYNIDYEQIKQGLPPHKITRIVKCVKYVLIWEFDTKESYGKALQVLYETYEKDIAKCLIMPHDKLLGQRIY